MAHFLKITRTIVKIVAIVISLSFALNSINGTFGAFDLANGNILPTELEPGDVVINFEDLNIEIGVAINNTGTYPLDNIIVGMVFEISNNITNDWTVLLNTTSVELDPSLDENGDTILPSEKKVIGLNATLPDFELTPEEIASVFSLPANWSLEDLVHLSIPTVEYFARLTLTFAVSYAYGQYKLDFEIALGTDFIENGFGGS